MKNLTKEVGSSKELPTLSSNYQLLAERYKSETSKLEAKSNRIVLSRMAAFVCMVALLYLVFKLKITILLIPTFGLLAGFLYLVKLSAEIQRKINYCKILVTINEEEILALKGDFSTFDPGLQFVDYQHEYSFDLDVFGEHSIFRMVNRATTPQGKEKMASRLLQPGTDADQIRLRQEGVKELSSKLTWRQDFLATARESNWQQRNNRMIGVWLSASDKFTKTRFYSFAIIANSTISLCLLLLYLLPALFNEIFTFSLPPAASLYFLLPIGLVISKTRLINREQQNLEKLLDQLKKYAGLLNLIETETFDSSCLKDLQKKLQHGEFLSSAIMKKLTGILWGLELRGNMIVSFLLNTFFLWDILTMIRLEKWRSNYRDAFEGWIDTIAEFETLNSLATFSFNHPDFTWPDMRDGEFTMEIEDGGHPLINPAKRVDNSLSFDESGQIYLITGANMAGKSTLLRMVGVNMILAMAGGPVCAKRFTMVPVALQTSVRTNDSLGDDESYFYAELKKLSRMISRIEQGQKTFIIIDEMLKGTNSRDKHTGSAALICHLIDLKTSGLVASHDVELGKLEADYPGRLSNRCFEVITDGGMLKFDYLLQPGVSQNLNATFLMKKMGIIR
jgi:ABC-type multidrug transport system fused ATPase/permease subunit